MKIIKSIKIIEKEIKIGGSLPDIDLDIEGLNREKVKQYFENKYGHDKFCSLGTYTSLMLKAAIKDISRTKGLEIPLVQKISNAIIDSKSEWSELFNLSLSDPLLKKFIIEHSDIINLIELCYAQPRSASVHACATLLVPKDESIFTSVPLRTTDDGMLVSEWEGEFIEKAGYLKEDLLGLLQLDKFKMIITLVKDNYHEDVDIYSIPLDEKEVYEMFQQAQIGDVFQFGSKGLAPYLVQVRPENIEDLIAINALYRPGPIEGNAHNEFIELRHGDKIPVFYPGTEEITKDTFSLIIYQEQIMQICQAIGGFSLVEADDIRKAMGKKNQQAIDDYKGKWFDGANKNGCPFEVASELWEKMQVFGGYAFNRCFAGSEKIAKVSNNQYNDILSIEEMFLIKNDFNYAKKTNHLALRKKYLFQGYGQCLSLNKNNRLVKNNIIDIRDEGLREVFEVKMISGKTIKTTSNHKFPTNNGEKQLKDLDINIDLLFIKGNYEKTIYEYGLNKLKSNNYPLLGQRGFQSKNITAQKTLKEFSKNKIFGCQNCGTKINRLEIHHKDGDRTNNINSNFIILCSSCHKKEHYKIGRTKRNEKGYPSYFEKIKSIKLIGIEHVYDVEVSGEISHTLLMESGIVSSNSHSAAYAITGYTCQYLKWKYPLPFWITSLEFADDKNILKYLSEISQSNIIEVAPPDINKSDEKFIADFTTNKILWSIARVKQCGPVAVQSIFEERNKNGQFFSLEEFLERVGKSKVNKSVVENLIISGAFDDIEAIKLPSERRVLIEEYRSKMNVKVDENKDWFISASKESKFYDDWYWSLLQKQVSGLAFFDYQLLVKDNKEWNSRAFLSINEILTITNADIKRKRVVTAGFIQEIEEKESKKGPWMKILIEQNYEFIYLYLWSDLYNKFADLIRNQENNIIVFNGRVVFDINKKENIVQAEDDFKVEILSKM